MAANEASTHCIATKLNPRYNAFWQIPKRIVARHWPRVSRVVCPRAVAMATPISPETKNRSASAVSGGASITIIRAEVNAEDHIRAKASPMNSARRSILSSFYNASNRAGMNGTSVSPGRAPAAVSMAWIWPR